MNHQDLRSQVIAVQVIVLLAITVSFALLSSQGRRELAAAVSATEPFRPVPIAREVPVRIEPLYDDPSVVSEENLALVLEKVRPKFNLIRLSPNYVEHALRAWGGFIDFPDESVMDGPEMVRFLTDHGAYLQSWGDDAEPILMERPDGVAINWGAKEELSVHHDHWLASLTEAGVPIDTPIFGPGRRGDTLADALQEALRDFQTDEMETEWSAMAFGFWLPPTTKQWINGDGRLVDFNLLADRLMRGHRRFGVCSGTHRVYSLMVLLRLDDEFQILSAPKRDEIFHYLERVRDLMVASQLDDGRSPAAWAYGADAIAMAEDELEYKQVIATGHHLEWLAIAYPELQPPREVVRKAADWIVETTRIKTQQEILSHYTFYSHVGNALALWRKTHPADFWTEWRQTHPLVGGDDATSNPGGQDVLDLPMPEESPADFLPPPPIN
ncbi:hypothetical protein [Stratiformator vulcanicus]|uniref:Uncharacterized protein n=1 Tax=Stratiformator vulcanicus TaxID=2527980 RepID=A0A517QW53_9PLAN|nr:hypothetical protein [Stratiformator vulcanicus]QDT35800.1 hypothetical protein Pan189_01530 [Stratiformator vulcanicus]